VSESHLIAVAFDDQHAARKHLDELYRLQESDLLTLEGAAVLEIDSNGRPTIHQPETLAEKGLVAGAVVGGAVGTLVGAMTMNPIIGGVLGLSIGSVSTAGAGAMVDAVIEDGFIAELATQLKPDSSATFVHVSSDRPYAAILEMKPPGGTILSTTLNRFDEEKLQKVLEGKLEGLLD
jgi:uncharacterized membrane protein